MKHPTLTLPTLLSLLFCTLTAAVPAAMAQRAAPDLNQYGRAYLAEGDNNAAAKSYGEVVRQNPFDPVALNNMAVAKAAAGDYQSAAEMLARAVRLAPHRADIRENYTNIQGWQDATTNVPLALNRPRPTQLRGPAILPEPPPLWPAPRRAPSASAGSASAAPTTRP